MGINLVGWIGGRYVTQRHFKFIAVRRACFRCVKGNVQLAGSGCANKQSAGSLSLFHSYVAHFVVISIGECRRIALRAVLADRTEFQSDRLVLVKHGFDIENVVIGAAEINTAAVGHNAVQVVLFNRVVIRDIPFDDHLTVRICVINSKTGWCCRFVGAVGNLQTADIHLIVFRLTLKFERDGRNRSAGICGEVDCACGPVAGSRAVFKGDLFRNLRRIFKDQAELHRCIVRGRFLKGQVRFGVFVDIKVCFVKVHRIRTGKFTVQYKRTAPVICTDLCIRKCSSISGSIVANIFCAVIKISRQFGVIRRGDPPLPSRKNVLNVDVCPFLVFANCAVFEILHTVTRVKIRVKRRTIDNGALCDKIRHADPAGGVRYADVCAGIAGLFTGIRRIAAYAGEEHSLTLCDHPLILVLLHQRFAAAAADRQLVNTPLIPVARRKQCNTCARIVCFIIQPRDAACTVVTAAEFVLVAFQSVEDFFKRIRAD